MIKINLVCVGKIKEQYFDLGVKEYVKRLDRYCDLSIIEVLEENYKKVDDGAIEVILQKEKERILPHLKGFVIAMAIEGKKYSSKQFSNLIESCAVQGNGTITLVIGGSYGLAKQIKDKANLLISFSDMTFPHTLFRLMAVEQIYRAFCIKDGVAYHK